MAIQKASIVSRILAGGLLLWNMAASPVYAQSVNPAVTPIEAPAKNQKLAVIEPRILGNPDAKVKIVEYSSMTCPHCAAFHTTILPRLKQDYIDTGKVSLQIVDFPFDGLALRAAMIVRCVPADRYFNFVDVLYQNQERWARSRDQLQSLETYGALAGLGAENIRQCLENEPMMNAILTRQLEAQEKLGVRSTPTFIINNGQDKIIGAESYENFQRVLDGILNDG
jgi:protein-disulfide isomerase